MFPVPLVHGREDLGSSIYEIGNTPPAVDVLRQVWIQQYVVDEPGTGVIWRDADTHGLPPGRALIVSPYDIDARHGEKRGCAWTGYKVHITETCDNTDDDVTRPPNLITNVVTTHASVDDSTMTMPIHRTLADRDLLPAEHLMDAGYPSAAHLVACRSDYGVRLISPVRADSSPQARAATGFERAAFTIDFDRQRATCPKGHHSATWNPVRQAGQDAIVITFPIATCVACPARDQCTRSRQRRRQLTIRPQPLHEALRNARVEQTTDAWKADYRARAGIEGTIRQTVAVTGIRHARYTGLPKVDLEHAFAATAVNLIRLDAWWTRTPLERTRATHLSRLNLTLAA